MSPPEPDLDSYEPPDPESSGVVRRQRLGSSSSPAVRVSAPAKPAVPFTDEQMRIIECRDQKIVGEAFAGCGKTTTAVGFAQARPRERILYICLNRANAEEARTRFASNVDCKTTHQLAYRAMRQHVADRISRRWKPLLVRDQLRLPSNKAASVTMRILQSFWGSADVEITEKHAESVRQERGLDAADVMNNVAYARLAWKRMLDPSDTLQMPDDAYLKMYGLRNPQLDYDTIIFDEAQDANPVTAQIVKAQQRAKLLCIGDRHQSIYQFRGSINAMEEFAAGSTRLHLSQTWRFGPRIANLANLLLSEFKGETVPIKGMAADGRWDPAQVTTLARTNAELFRLAALRRGEGVHWVGGAQNYRLDLVMDVYHLFARNRSDIKDESLRKFNSFQEYKDYAEDAADGEANILCKVVEEFGHEIPEVIEQIIANAVPSAEEAAQVLTTAHKAKGLDWNCVQIANDFEVLEPLEEQLAQHHDAAIPVQDINLLYVALTRAKRALQLNDDTLTWLERLPQHRINRQAAENRHNDMMRRLSQPSRAA